MDNNVRAPLRVSHQNGLCQAQVVAVETVSPRMRRITFQAPEFARFTSAAADDHVKLFFDAGQGAPADRVARDYTPRRFDLAARELTIEFVLHATGPASDWASRARPGDVIGIGGPRGSLILPEDYQAYLLAGDETALPAIARRLEEMAPGTVAIAIIEVADRHEERHLATAANAKIIWLHRNGKPAGLSGLLEEAVRKVQLPYRDMHAWIACEIEVARRLRTYLMEEEALPRSQIKAAGYWRIGQAGAHDKID